VTDDTATEDTATETDDDGKQLDGPKGLREALDRSKTKAAKLQAQVERLAYEKVGLDPTTGMGKAIAQTFEGEVDPDDVQPLVEFAQAEFDVKLEVVGSVPAGTTQPAVSEGVNRLSKVEAASSEPKQPDTRQARADEAFDQGRIDMGIAEMVAHNIEHPIDAPPASGR
jgi:hypothetical protein